MTNKEAIEILQYMRHDVLANSERDVALVKAIEALSIDISTLISFELNNWFAGRDYPDREPFKSWIVNHAFDDDEWCRENRLVVLTGSVDMSRNWCITATKEWAVKNCPELLRDIEYTYKTVTHSRDGDKVTWHGNSMSSFIRYPDEDGNVDGRFGWSFPEYCEENFGVHWYEENDDE